MMRIAMAGTRSEQAASPEQLRSELPGMRCGGCGTRYHDDGWRELLTVEQLEAPEVRRFARNWPDDVCVEVRLCARCGVPIAVKMPRSAL